MDTATMDTRVQQIIDHHDAREGALIEILLDIQQALHWLPAEALDLVSERLKVPMGRIRHTATFYKAFSLVPKGRHEINVCMGTACHVRGAQRVLEVIENATGLKPGETDAELKYSLDTVNCIGCCALGPVVEIDKEQHGKLVPGKATALLKKYD